MKFEYGYITEKNINKNDIISLKQEPVITIVTPYYNGGKYIKETAKAILNQTYPYFEWLIIDDGSKDEESLEILKEIEKLDDRIKVFHKENTGLANTRDYGAKHSAKSAKYLIFLDDDDLIINTYLECAYWTLETNEGASWAFSDVVHFGEYEALATTRYNPMHEIKQNVLVATALIKKEDFFKVGGYELKEKAINEDWNLWLKMIAADMYPVRMSFFGFCYRRKVNTESELYRASKNQERTKAIIAETAKNIKNPKEGIQYPKQDYNWDLIPEEIEKIVRPQYKENGKIKILMIIPWMVIGGADKFNVDLIKGLDKNKFEVTLITTEPNYHVWREKYEYDTKAIYDLTSFIDRKYWLSFVNYIIQKNNIDIIFNTNSTFGYSILPDLKAKYPEKPIIDYIHMEEWYNRNGGFSRDSSLVESVIDKTFVCNENSKKILVNHFNRKEEEIKTVYIGVDENKFNPLKYNKEELKEKYNLKDNNKVITFMARIDYQKRPILFIKVLERLLSKSNNITAVIAGDGPLLPKMKEMAKQAGIDNKIKFLGAVKETEEIYAISDLTVNCSIKEGLALTTYESLSMGVPVVSADVGGQAEIINNNVGVIVKCLQNEEEVRNLEYTAEEIDSYTDGIIKVLKNLDFYKSNARQRVLNGFTINQMIENMSNEFINLTQNINEEKYLNGKKLNSNKNICLELITKYFMAFSNEYNWLVEEFNRKLDIEVNKSVENFVVGKAKKVHPKKNIAFKNKVKNITTKLHIYNESILIYNIGCLICYFVKELIKFVLDFIKTVLKFSRDYSKKLFKILLLFIKLIRIRFSNIFTKKSEKKTKSFDIENEIKWIWKG